MKLLYCEKCGDLVTLKSCITRSCTCAKYAGKYLDDYITAVVNEGAILVGIDNNTFITAVERTLYCRDELDYRIDFFFAGWLPTIPGEVIFVSTFEDVLHYPDHIEGTEYKSTNPVSKPVPPLDRKIREGEQPPKRRMRQQEFDAGWNDGEVNKKSGKVDWRTIWHGVKRFFSLNP